MYTAGIEHIGVYHNNPEITPAENMMSDVCLRVCKPVEPSGDIAVKEIPGGRFIVFTCAGEYHKVGEAYDKFTANCLQKTGLNFAAIIIWRNISVIIVVLHPKNPKQRSRACLNLLSKLFESDFHHYFHFKNPILADQMRTFSR